MNSEDFHKHLARDMGIPDHQLEQASKQIEDILWRMNDDPNLPRPKHIDIPDGEQVTFKSTWKRLTPTQKRNLIKEARGEEPDSEFLGLIGPGYHLHSHMLSHFVKAFPSFKTKNNP